MAENKKDFFISYNGKDKDWAEWIAWQLKEAGYSLVIQAWDFRPGGNFIVEMQKAAQADRTLIVLSPNYLEAVYTQPEWAAAFVQDPTGAKRTLLPVRVAECKPSGLLAPIIYIDLVGLEEAAAMEKLLAGIPPGPVPPSTLPPFPSGQEHAGRPPPRFPEPLPLIRKIRDRIRSLLKEPRGIFLQDAIAQQAGEQSAVAALVPQQPDSLLDALNLMYHATVNCLQKLKAEQKPTAIDPTKEVAREVFGWLVLLAVNIEQVNRSGCSFDPWKDGIEVTIPLELEAGTEVLVSYLGDRAAWFTVKYDNRNRPRVVGRDAFSIDGPEMGIGQTDPLTEILKCIWVEVRKSEAPIPFGPKERNQLQAMLKGRQKRKQSHYYITIPSQDDGSPLSDKALLRRLLEVLPSLRIMYIGSGQGEGILLLNEYDLWESILAFLEMLRDLP